MSGVLLVKVYLESHLYNTKDGIRSRLAVCWVIEKTKLVFVTRQQSDEELGIDRK